MKVKLAIQMQIVIARMRLLLASVTDVAALKYVCVVPATTVTLVHLTANVQVIND